MYYSYALRLYCTHIFHSQQSDDKIGESFIEMPTGKEVITVNHFHLLNTALDTLGVSNKLIDVYRISKSSEAEKFHRFHR